MAPTRKTPAAPCGMHEQPFVFGGRLTQARRNAGAADASRWQLFISGSLAGIVEIHSCEDFHGAPRLTARDAGNRVIGTPNPPGRGVCHTGGPCLDGLPQAVAVISADMACRAAGVNMVYVDTDATRATAASVARNLGVNTEPWQGGTVGTRLVAGASEGEAIARTLRRRGFVGMVVDPSRSR